ncbi:FAD-dependent monooxygenase [Vibrio tapetis]|uniref:2-polyprenyl-6-methoxyphenol hydroxylase related FAD-dependent oxidoreductase n=1 Tax=Vibrio tapetis subsp. tapetis TaxID=1671868 RepID=A0A2N8ZJV5_9VIBR
MQKNTAIHRSRLQSTLLAQLDSRSVSLGKTLTDLEKCRKTQLTFSDGSQHHCDIVIGADGIHSKVRESLHCLEPAVYRNAHQLCWRGVAKASLPNKYHGQLNELWGGQGSRFGFVAISDTEVYWYALVNDDAANIEFEQLFSSFDPIVMSLIEQTDNQKIFHNGIKDLAPIKHWFDESLVLVGDAAHATTPNLGQGACQGIEDAYVLAHCLARYLEPNTPKEAPLDRQALKHALAQYQQLRLSKAHYVVNTSWKMGKVSQWQHPVLAKTRNALFRLMPDKLNEMQSRKLFTLADV